ncbi:placenta-specific gene 8 protein-like isoform X2 [Hippoglossus hippoglossus]|uniref:placenta-specific gene 8 protein-like isoform X2 n=1 Tax=Hippoglossus hippoglossus TaxID=8267 RepID=UPI00148BB03D|nr:placenta-specific gene 8 protein-like isoform X2 [Hippoglossus hippoglossus]
MWECVCPDIFPPVRPVCQVYLTPRPIRAAESVSAQRSHSLFTQLCVRMWPQAPIMSYDEADWASGICDCWHNTKQCCCLFWCCPCFACNTSKQFGQCLCLPLLDVFGCFRPITMSMRTSARHRYGIKPVQRLFVLHPLSVLCLGSNLHRDEEQEDSHRTE